MKRLLPIAASLLLLCSAGAVAAGEAYELPKEDAQYKQCLGFAKKLGWEGGGEKSPNKGQTKLQAFCACMWHETPDDFKGNLATFAESKKGKELNKMCEKYADWGD